MVIGKVFENVIIFFKLKGLLKNFPFQPHPITITQLVKLKKLVIHAYKNFSFYKKLMDDADFDPHALKTLEDLRKLPVIDKTMYRDFTDSIVRKNPSFYRTKFHVDGTSGSTGMPLKIYRSWQEKAHIKADVLRALRLNGYGVFDKTLWIISPHRLTSRDSFFQRFGIMPRHCVSYLETPDNMCKAYVKVNPDVLWANKSQLNQLALYVKSIGIEIQKPKILVCTAETLDANSRRLIQDVFGEENLIEIYGAIEFGILGFQLKGRGFLYPCHDSKIIELDNHGNFNSMQGNCIVTDLNIFSFPLIRYRLGDWLEMEESKGLPIIKRIRGRMDDWITWKDGSRIPFYFFMRLWSDGPRLASLESYRKILISFVSIWF